MGSSVPVKEKGSGDGAQACFTLASESSSNSLLPFFKIIILLLSLKSKTLPLVYRRIAAEILTRQPRKLRDHRDTQLKVSLELSRNVTVLSISRCHCDKSVLMLLGNFNGLKGLLGIKCRFHSCCKVKH